MRFNTTTSKISGFFAALILSGTAVVAQNFEYDDMYFNSSDREALKAYRAAQQSSYAYSYNNRKSEVNPTDGYSARKRNPEYDARMDSEALSENYIDRDYYDYGYNNFRNPSNNYYYNRYNSPWMNSYYSYRYNNYNSWYYDPFYDMYSPWNYPLSGWSMSLNYGWGNSWSPGWGWAGNYGWGWNNPYYYNPYYYNSFYSPYYGGWYGSPGVIVIRENSGVYGKRTSRSGYSFRTDRRTPDSGVIRFTDGTSNTNTGRSSSARQGTDVIDRNDVYQYNRRSRATDYEYQNRNGNNNNNRTIDYSRTPNQGNDSNTRTYTPPSNTRTRDYNYNNRDSNNNSNTRTYTPSYERSTRDYNSGSNYNGGSSPSYDRGSSSGSNSGSSGSSSGSRRGR